MHALMSQRWKHQRASLPHLAALVVILVSIVRIGAPQAGQSRGAGGAVELHAQAVNMEHVSSTSCTILENPCMAPHCYHGFRHRAVAANVQETT